MSAMKTPGVYIVEKNAFPNSVVEVATAVPAFIGYTEKAANGNKSLLNKPWRVTSMAEFRSYFGEAPKPKFELAEGVGSSVINFNSKSYLLKRTDSYILYYSMLLFYANGGGPCYIVSVGDYSTDIEKDKLEQGINPLIKEQEPTMVVIPEAIVLQADDCYALQTAILRHCGYEMRNRFAVLDVHNGYKDRKDPDGDVVAKFRENIGSEFLDFGAAYYPWLNTSIVQENELNYENLDIANLQTLLTEELDNSAFDEEKKKQIKEYIDGLKDGLTDVERSTLHKILSQLSFLYRDIMKEMRISLNLLPVSAAMAGTYTMVDNTKGVWKAPANVGIATAISPTVNISHEEQEDLNVPLSGKSVNAIRTFIGEGIKVWGARTLDGNSLDWRYINVRRTMIMLQESVKNAARAYVFDPNEANTWINVKSMISNFLNGIWKRGGLAGAVPDDAYSVHIGLGDTMTPEDILEGIMRITVLVAITRPAEFIEITFQQQMQKS
ncbi:phage tail sheath family protein [Dysgonomonas sp. ZJ709]|uniref:phage tail sheath family protein n=1 Tax=Dysgonomonas sp. ZJ709 TaxID=2709797 RepID=UPI0013EC08F5|nr:phage tail sheath family protein [Dysgonomonas sp. ZJ709]